VKLLKEKFGDILNTKLINSFFKLGVYQ